MYTYTGAYHPITNEALGLDGTCDVPAPSELGDFIGAQNAAANLNVPATFPVTVTVAGSGQVRDAPGTIRCPSACLAALVPGTSVTLAAKPDKGVFSGWTGACAGDSLTCTYVQRKLECSGDGQPQADLQAGREGEWPRDGE